MESSFLFSGILFGLSAGLSPGPMLTLVISESMRKGTKAGITVASAPLLTDFPIILVTQWLLVELSQINYLLGVISMTGSLLLGWYAWESLSIKAGNPDATEKTKDSLKKGVFTNLTNPNPYLFWISIGGPVLLESYKTGYGTTILFLASMYVFLIGSKASLAILVAKSRHFLNSQVYFWVLRILGIALAGFSVHFFLEALVYFE